MKNIKVGTLFKKKLEKNKGRYRYHLKKNLKNIKLGILFYKNLKNIQVGRYPFFKKLEKYKGRFRYPFLKKLEKHKGRYGTGTLFKKN